MRFTGEALIRSTVLVCLTIAGCSGSGGESTTGLPPSSAAASSGGAAASSGSGGGSTTQSLGTATGEAPSTSSGTGGMGSGGSSTGAPPIAFVDGGYVSCSLAFAPDAGADGGGGPAHWDCRPGTYTCDPSGDIGQCFQCLSDQDCANQRLPTYDPRRPHCDLNSGIVGYQNFCQECVADSNCSGNPAGRYCELSSTYPTGSSQPPIENLGFEHCGKLLTDCRVDGGPGCVGNNAFCDQTNGVCVTNPGACVSDKDCLGFISAYNPYLPEPFCVKGTCNSCEGGLCPNAFCESDADCGNPDGGPDGLLCNLATYQCTCTDSSQCGGFWPVCENLAMNDAGQIQGTCGCDSTEECADGGLICLPPSQFNPTATTSCGLPCTSPEFQACRTSTYLYPVCNPTTGACGPCTNDDQCRNGVETGGYICDYLSGGKGNCGCIVDSDCPIGATCGEGPFLIGLCTASLTGCSPSSCGTYFCDWDAGACLTNLTVATLPSCITDYDCSTTYSSGSLCENGECIACRTSADCVAHGQAANGYSVCCQPDNPACASLPSNTCEDVCNDDQDCAGNLFGPSCVLGDAGYPPKCGCGSDLDCSGATYGSHCDMDPSDFSIGTCNCQSNSDCAPGSSCQIFAGETFGYCGSYCYGGDSGLYPCAPGYFCDPTSTCRPRCDDDNTCQAPDQVCDTQNVAGKNGETINGTSAGVTWCYRCLSPSDCPAGLGCSPFSGCGNCATTADCPSGTACIDGGVCQPTCTDGACPNGEICDTYGLAGFGPNVCYGCLGPSDCPEGEGCNSQSHTCGTCFGPTASSGPYDCPPDAICSNYWSPLGNYYEGVCLSNCDRQSCPASEPICAVYPGLTPDHSFCFGCLQDSDCADAGPGTHCNLAPNPTFTCVAGK